MTGAWSGWHVARRVFAVLFAGFMLMPLAVVLIASFTDESYVRFPPMSYGIRWYLQVFRNGDLMGGLVISLQIAASIAVLSGAFGVAAAVAVARAQFPGRDALVALITMPLAVPHVVLALALLQNLAIIGVATAPWGILAGHLLITLPYVMRLTLTSLHDFDRQFERASQSLGASSLQTFRHVILPMIAPGVIAGVFFAFLLSFDEVTISIFLSLPGRTTLPAQIFTIAENGSDPVITAASGLLIAIATVLVLFVERYFGALRLILGTGAE